MPLSAVLILILGTVIIFGGLFYFIRIALRADRDIESEE